MKESFFKKLKTKFNPFKNNYSDYEYNDFGAASSYRPWVNYRNTFFNKTDLVSIYNKIATDIANIELRHVLLDSEGLYSENVSSNLNHCINMEANIDQSAFTFMQDLVISMFDEGVVAIVITHADVDETNGEMKEIYSIRVARLLEYHSNAVVVNCYNESTGEKEDITVLKSNTVIIENPLYSVINEANSTIKQLAKVLNDLDVINSQSASGKLDIIIQLPFQIRTEAKREEAEKRRALLEQQMSGAKYGVGYIDGTERITQLNRPSENNLMAQVEFLSNKLYSLLGMSKSIFDGTATPDEIKNYHIRTIYPILKQITQNMNRVWFSRNLLSRGNRILPIKNIFDFISDAEYGGIIDVLSRNAILNGNEVRNELCFIKSKQTDAGALENKNIKASERHTINDGGQVNE